MKIAQISDTHIAADGRLVDGVDTREHFDWSLEAATRSNCDLIVLSGDLAATERDWAAYPWLAARVAALPIPTLVMSGNHDNTAEVVRCFGLEADFHAHDGTLRHARRFGDTTVCCLDTSSTELSAEQLDWLQQQRPSWHGTEPLLFLHHPPLTCGHRFMDSHYPLQNREDTWRRLLALEQIQHVFCGHYHTHKEVVHDGIHVVLCPSTVLQIDAQSPNFAIEHTRPGYLEIEVHAGRVRWQAVYREA